MAKKKYVVTLESAERVELQKMVSSGKSAARKLTHARILLLADVGPEGPGHSDNRIVEALGVGERTVSRVRQRFVEEGLEAAINPRPRPRQPSKFEGELEEQIVALAKSDPPEGRARWTLRLLANQVVQLEMVEEASHESVRKVLKKTV